MVGEGASRGPQVAARDWGLMSWSGSLEEGAKREHGEWTGGGLAGEPAPIST